MTSHNQFRTATLVGREPSLADAPVYTRIFGRTGQTELARNLQDFERHRIAPWTLEHAGRDIGVGGFRLGFGHTDGMELCVSVLPDRLPIGLAGEFLSDALAFATDILRADRVFTLVDGDTTLTRGMLQRQGFEAAGAAPRPGRPDLILMRWCPPS
jgi:hypothetical protein